MPEFDVPGVPPLKADTFNEIDLVGATAGTVVMTAKVSGDAQSRFTMAADGTMSWGPGNGAVDVTFARSGVGAMDLKSGTTPQALNIYGSTTGPKILTLSHSGSTGLINVQGGGDLTFQLNTVNKWTIPAAGASFSPVNDNANDIGIAATNRVRSIYWATQALAPDGAATAGNVSYSFASGTSTGMYCASPGADVSFSIGGTRMFAIQANSIQLLSNTASMFFGAAADTVLTRDAANIFAQKNGVNAQTFRVYGTTTGPHYMGLNHSGTIGLLFTNTTDDLQFGINGSAQWKLEGATGHLKTLTDNTYDIGASGALRPRTIYSATSFITGTGQTWAPIAQAGAEGSKFSFSGTLTSSPADFNAWTFTPVLAGAFTVTRFNYLDLNNITGAATITDACVMRFDAAAGTHKATVGATTKTTPGTVNGWVKINMNGTIMFMPAYTSTTS